MASTEDQTKPPKKPKQHQVEVPKGQHDILANLLNQKTALENQISVALGTTVAGVKHKVPDGAQFAGTATGMKFGRPKHYLLFVG